MSTPTNGDVVVPDTSRRTRLSVPALIAAAAVSNAGNYLTSIAIPWFVLVTTGSAARTGLVAFATILPVVVSGVFGGAFVDRVGAKRASIISDIASGVTVAVIPTLYLLDVLQFWHLLVLTFLGAMLDVPGGAARQTMIPRLARQIGMPLERINATYHLAVFGASVAGPLLAGVLIASVGASSVLYFNTGTFVVSALVVALGVQYAREDAAPEEDDTAEQRTGLKDALAGLSFLKQERVLRNIAFVSIFANFLFSPLFAVMFPVYVKEVFDDPRALGLLVASLGVGSVVSTIWYGAYGPRIRRHPILTLGVLLAAMGLWAMPFATHMAVSVTIGFAIGLAIGPINTIAMVVLQERVPESMLGRVNGALFAASQLAAPAGVLIAGFAIEGFSIRTAMLTVAAGVTVTAVWVGLAPAFHHLERPDGERAPALEKSAREPAHPR